jgi:hypothetical protein
MARRRGFYDDGRSSTAILFTLDTKQVIDENNRSLKKNRL